MDRKLLYSTVALIGIGMVMVYSSSSVMAENRFGSHFFFLKRQFVWLIMAGIAAWVVMKIDLKKYAAYSVPLIFISLALLALVFVMPARNGSHRWLFIGPFTIQPSEIFKLLVIVYLAFSLSQKKRDITNLKQFLLPYVPLIGAGLMLIILEPGLGSAMTITLTVLTIFFLAGVRLYHLSVLTLPLVGLVSFMVFVLGYKKPRVIDYMSAISDPLSGSYQVKQAVLALGAGGIFGSGLGDGRQKLFFLPYPHTDFIFASIGEEVGFVGLTVILILFFIIIRQGFKIALYQPDKFGYLLAMGITASIFTSVIINIGVVTSLLPTTGIPLPFISYGGSALLISVISVSVLLNLSRRKGVVVR
ncbi:MAG TPA: putative lipid II flippase FtsW [candidate division Zixibacteria bacterium]|nr:putative lipid II flippase FtsW [candidate division Zixibacteria bacterium]